MTLLELLKLLKTRLKLVIALPVICAALTLAYLLVFVQPSYTATASLVVNGQFQFVSAFAETAAQEASTGSITVTSTPSSSTNTVSLEAEGPSTDAVIEAANEAASDAAEQSRDTFSDIVVEVSKATSAASEGRSPAVYAAVAFLGGLFVAVVIVVIEDMVVRRVHDWTSVTELAGIPYLGTCGGNRAERDRLAAEVSLAGATDDALPQTVCLVPVGAAQAEVAFDQLREVPSGRLSQVVAAPSLAEGADALFAARKAQATVLVVQEETSTFGDLETTLRELGVAGVKPVGFVYMLPGKAARKSKAGRHAQ